MEPKIKLKEIIYEITSKCNNGCSYCGSKEVTCDTHPTEEQISKIVDNICSYPPEEINISGGDPLLLDYKIHLHIFNKLRLAKVKTKILVNPLSFQTLTIYDSNKEKLELYDWS